MFGLVWWVLQHAPEPGLGLGGRKPPGIAAEFPSSAAIRARRCGPGLGEGGWGGLWPTSPIDKNTSVAVKQKLKEIQK